jgi:hypothetical protein
MNKYYLELYFNNSTHGYFYDDYLGHLVTIHLLHNISNIKWQYNKYYYPPLYTINNNDIGEYVKNYLLIIKIRCSKLTNYKWNLFYKLKNFLKEGPYLNKYIKVFSK